MQGTSPLDHQMPNQNHEVQEEEYMKDAIPEGLDLIGLEDACTRKAFKCIPLKQIQLLHKALVKEKAQLGVATSRQKEKQNAQKDPKKRDANMIYNESTVWVLR